VFANCCQAELGKIWRMRELVPREHRTGKIRTRDQGTTRDRKGDQEFMSDALKIVTHEDAALAKKPPVRAAEQEAWIEVDSSKLIDLLDDIDGLKYEIHERMRRIEAVKQARSVLQEDAVKTAALNKRLAELGRAMGGAHAGLRVAEPRHEEAEPFRVQPRESLRETESHPPEVRGLAEGAALPWRKQEESVDSSLNTYQAPVSQLPEAPNGYRGNADAVAEASIVLNAATERLERAEQAWKLADQAALEAKRLFDESTSKLDQAVSLEGQATADFQSAQLASTAARESANERLEAAERCWREADQITVEAKRLLDQSASELALARKKEEAVTADLQSIRQEFTSVYQSATEHLEEAERFWKQGDQAAVEAKKMFEQSTFQLTQSRAKEESATSDLLSARQELTTAYQFAAVAAQRRLDAEEFFQKAIRWAIFATAFSWTAMAWMSWLIFRTFVPIWGPCIFTVIIVVLAFVIGRKRTSEV
jgi:hypothetical protein